MIRTFVISTQRKLNLHLQSEAVASHYCELQDNVGDRYELRENHHQDDDSEISRERNGEIFQEGAMKQKTRSASTGRYDYHLLEGLISLLKPIGV